MEAPEVYICYSSADQDRVEELLDHLKPAMDDKHFDCWSHKKIPPGTIRRDEIKAAIASAKIAILVVSSDFLASPFVNEEFPLLLEAARKGDLTLLWLPESASGYEMTELKDLEPVHPPDEPLDTLGQGKRQEALVEISKKIVTVLEERRSPANGARQGLQSKVRGTPATDRDQVPAPIVLYVKIAVIILAGVGLIYLIGRAGGLWEPAEPPQTPPENRVINISVKERPLQEIFKEVARQIGAVPAVDPKLTGPPLSVSIEDAEVKDFMNEICHEMGKCTWKIQPGNPPALIVLPPGAAPLSDGGR